MGHVQINLFGSFHVERDGKSVDEQLARSPKGMLLMQYLILSLIHIYAIRHRRHIRQALEAVVQFALEQRPREDAVCVQQLSLIHISR